jgi:hypothetical protein
LKRARLLLLAAAALAVGGLLWPEPPALRMAGKDDDMTMYGHIVARVHAGESYWDATGSELERGNYPLRPMFNWREPLYAWLFAAFPSPLFGQGLLLALALVVVLWTYTLMRAEGIVTAAAAAIFQGTVFAAAGTVYFSTELWAGVLIALSAAAYARRRTAVGFAAAISALFFRELALPWCAVCFLQASKRERLAWAVGLVAWGGYFALHASRVAAHLALIPPSSGARSWLALGGLGFVLRTLRSNGFLLEAPRWLLALLFPLSLLGMGALPEGFARVKLAVLLYVAAFLFVGLPFDFYWGFVYVPLLLLGLARALTAVPALAKAAFTSPPAQ